MWLLASHIARYGCNLKIVEPADQATFDTLVEEFFEHDFIPLILSVNFNLQNQGMLNCCPTTKSESAEMLLACQFFKWAICTTLQAHMMFCRCMLENLVS